MTTPASNGSNKRRQRAPAKRGRTRAIPAASVVADPAYAEALSHMQEGRWEQAREALRQLRARYPAAEQAERLEGLLDLRLSAEETWAEAESRLRGPWLRRQAIRALLIANAAVYLLLGALWLFAERAGQLH